MARQKRYVESMLIRFEAGIAEAIDRVKGAREDRSEFVRVAVDNEIKRREGLAI